MITGADSQNCDCFEKAARKIQSQCEQYSLHSINGDIAIQSEWSKFDPSLNTITIAITAKLCTIHFVHETNT